MYVIITHLTPSKTSEIVAAAAILIVTISLLVVLFASFYSTNVSK